MRKIVFLFLLGLNHCFGQLVLGGVPSGSYNTFSNGMSFQLGIPINSVSGSPWPSLIPDTGTNMYSIDNGFNYNGAPDYYIIRQGNKWRIGSIWGYFPTGYTWELSSYSSSIDPPCNGLWIRQLASFVSGNPINTPSGDLDLLTLTDVGLGSCFTSVAPILCGTSIQCEGLQLSQISTTQLNALTSVQPGFLAYNAALNNLSWYNGLTWEKIYNGSGNFSVGGNFSVSGSSAFSSIINTNQINNVGLLSNNRKRIFDQSIVINKLSFFKTGLYEHEIYPTGTYAVAHTLDGTTFMELNSSELLLPLTGIKTNGVSTFNSGIRVSTVSTNTPITLNGSNYLVIFTSSTNCTLPSASMANKGQVYKLINHSTGSINISPSITTGSITTLSSLTSGQNLEIVSDGTVWRKTN